MLGLGTVGHTLARVLFERVKTATVLAHDPDSNKAAPKGVKRATFTEAVGYAEVIFLCVPTHLEGRNLKGKGWSRLSSQLREKANPAAILVIKTTLAPGDAESLAKMTGLRVVVCPEFVSEGSAYEDMLRPHRVLLGGSDPIALDKVAKVLRNWVSSTRILRMDSPSAQLAKLAANAMLAQRVASINTLATVSHEAGGSIWPVARALKMDPRIGSLYLNPSAGFGGSCLEKDIRLLADYCVCVGLPDVAVYWKGVIRANDEHIARQASKLSRLAGPKGTVCLLGLAFKEGTADTRQSAALRIAAFLIAKGHRVIGHDPLVRKTDVKGLSLSPNPSRAVRGAKVIALFHSSRFYRKSLHGIDAASDVALLYYEEKSHKSEL